MTCDRIRPLLSGYHDDALSTEERARVRAHLSRCAACSAVCAAYEHMYATLQRAVAPVPPELRRNVYARIAEIEARRNAGPPFATAFLGLLRSVGGTAGLLAVLAALLAAIVRLGAPQPQHAGSLMAASSAHRISAANAALRRMIGAVRSGNLGALPAEAQTAVAPLAHVLAAGAAWDVDRMSVGAAGVTVDGHVLRITGEGAPLSVVPVHVRVTAPREASGLAGNTAVKSVIMGTPSPIPTIPAGDGIVYVHLGSIRSLLDHAPDPRADIEWHAFARVGPPLVLVTPGPSPTHFAVRQASLQWDERLLLSVAGSAVVTMAITPSDGPRAPARPGALGTSVDDYAVAPDRRHIAWVQPGGPQAGRLEVADLGARPLTRTIGLGSHPVWAPDGRSLLFLWGSARRTGLAMWSARDGSIRRLTRPDPSGRQVIGAFAWAPSGRFFTYIVTSPGAGGTSTAWLGDAQTGYTWPSPFSRRWIGAVAWVHGRAFQAAAGSPRATPTHGAVSITVQAPGTRQALGAGGTATTTSTPYAQTVAGKGPSQNPAPRPDATPTPYDDTSSAAAVLRSFYDAINRRDFRRAYSYLSFTDGRTVRQFTAGYLDTQYDSIVRLLPARYLGGAGGHVITCVGLQLLAHNRDGQIVRYGGWYLVKSTTGQNPHVAGWRIQMPGTHMKRGGTATVPRQARCAPPPTPTPIAG